jgi:tetratricopeptide (TPR) repeat protein
MENSDMMQLMHQICSRDSSAIVNFGSVRAKREARRANGRYGLQLPSLSFILSLLLLFIVRSPLLAAGPLDAANIDYENGKFEQAKVEYIHLIEQHKYSPELFYNLGNAWFRLGDFGRAILNFRRALLLDPNFPEAHANLRTSLKLAGNNTTQTAREKLELYADYLPVAVSVAIWIAIFFFALRLLIHKPAPDFVWMIGVAAIILAVSGIGLFIWVGKGAKDPERGIVVEAAADLKYGPAISARPIESLRVGDPVKLISKRGEWTFCEAATGTVGWIPTQKIESLVP